MSDEPIDRDRLVDRRTVFSRSCSDFNFPQTLLWQSLESWGKLRTRHLILTIHFNQNFNSG